MASAPRIETLRVKHARLEAEIDREVHRPQPDEAHVAELKREKLRIKDQMARMAARH